MKKKWMNGSNSWYGMLRKLFLIMRLSLIFILAGFLHVSASTYSQNTKLNIRLKDASIKELFNDVKMQSEFTFVFNVDDVEKLDKITCDFAGSTVEEVLDLCLEGTDMTYTVKDKVIVIVPKEKEEVKFEKPAEQPQKKPITGKVTDEEGMPLPGVSVVVKGTTIGTVSDVDGNYLLEIPEDAKTLVLSFVGMQTQEIAIGEQTQINVTLEENTVGIEEVVAVGYGSLARKDVTGAVASVKSEDFNKGVTDNPAQLLQGKASGVNITQTDGSPNGNTRIVIRGQGSIRTGNGPLYVVDGFPVGTSTPNSNPLRYLNPSDIESIDVLKDASATAIYGSRGSNGVIIVTTKKGKTGQMKLSFDSSVGFAKMSNKIDVFTADEFRKNVASTGAEVIDWGGSTDWQDELTRTAIINNHNVSMYGGSEKFTYRASIGLMDKEGILKNTGVERYTARVNTTQKYFKDKLKIDMNFSGSVEKSEGIDQWVAVEDMLTFNPTFSPYDKDGNIAVTEDGEVNPLAALDLNRGYGTGRKMILNITPSYEIIPGLVYKLNFSYENGQWNNDSQQIPSEDHNLQGAYSFNFGESTNTLIENYFNYDLKFNDHGLKLLAGHSYQKMFGRGNNWQIRNFPDNGIEPRYSPQSGTLYDLANTRPGGWANKNELQSFFGRATYDYKGKYMLTATVRVDGSSKFGSNNRYGTFPSFAGSWRITEEEWMKDGLFSNLKLRAGYGETGNQEIPAKITQANYYTRVDANSSYPLDNSGIYVPGTTYVRFANPDIKWEVSKQANVGLDFGFFDNKLSGTFDYFNKVSTDILLEVVPSDPIQPASTYWTNVDDMEITNKGWELALNYQDNVGQLEYSFGGNMTSIKNSVEGSPYSVIATGYAEGSGLGGVTINGIVNGHPISSFYMKEFLGIGADGLAEYSENDDGGRMVVGKALPDFAYNFFFDLNYKRFNFSANFNGASGFDIYNHTAMNYFTKARLSTSWNSNGEAIKYPNEDNANPTAVSTRYLEDGSYLRLNNASLSYSLDTKNLGINWAEKINLSVTGQNLFVITDYSGYDPEVDKGTSLSGIQSFGIDRIAYPPSRTWLIGLNVIF